MKTINIKSAVIDEIVIRPNEDIAVSVSYKLLDDNDKVIFNKRITINKASATTQIQNIANKVLQYITNHEELG